MIDTSEEGIERRVVAAKREGFKKLMERPTTRLLISLLPPSGDKADVLDALLSETFAAGFDYGAGEIIGSLATSFASKPGTVVILASACSGVSVGAALPSARARTRR